MSPHKHIQLTETILHHFAYHACILCMHAYHAYSVRMRKFNTHARAHARKNQRRSSKLKPRPQKPHLRRGRGALRAPPSVVWA